MAPTFRPEPRWPEVAPGEAPLASAVRSWVNANGPWQGFERAKLVAFGHAALWVVSAQVVDRPGTHPWSWGEQRLWRVIDGVFEPVDLGEHRYGGPEIGRIFASRREGSMILLMRDGIFECDRSLTARLITRHYSTPCSESPSGDLYWGDYGEVWIVGPDGQRRFTVDTDNLGYLGFPRSHRDDRGDISHDPIQAVAIDLHGRVWILGADPAGEVALVRLDPSAVDEDGDWTEVEAFTAEQLGFEPTGLALDHRDEIVILDTAGRRHVQWDDDAEEAMIIDRLEAAIAGGPTTSAARALVTLGWKHKQANRLEEAIAAFERAMSLDDPYHSSDAQFRLGVLHLECGQPEVGVPLLEALIESGAPHAKPANMQLRFFRDREVDDSA